MATSTRQWTARKARDHRFEELLVLAREGNAEAIADLWKEYGFDFENEDPSNE